MESSPVLADALSLMFLVGNLKRQILGTKLDSKNLRQKLYMLITFKTSVNQRWWLKSIIPVFRRQRQ